MDSDVLDCARLDRQGHERQLNVRLRDAAARLRMKPPASKWLDPASPPKPANQRRPVRILRIPRLMP